MSFGYIYTDPVEAYGFARLGINVLTTAFHPADRSVGMIETVLDRIRPPFDDRPFYFAPGPLAVAFVDQVVIMFFITAKFAFLETEDRFQLLAPGDSTGRDIALQAAIRAALLRLADHLRVF